MSFKEQIDGKLRAGLNPAFLETIDESRLHAGHAGTAGKEGETHFRIRIVSEAFRGRSRLERHRLINSILSDELASRIHALSIDARAPGE